MDKASTIIAIITGLFAIVAGVASGVGLVARLLLAPVLLRLDNLEKAIGHETEQIKHAMEQQDERHRKHTGDSEKHISADWRQALDRRLERIEGYLIELARPK